MDLTTEQVRYRFFCLQAVRGSLAVQGDIESRKLLSSHGAHLLRFRFSWQAAQLAQGLATGSQSAALQQEMHSMHVPWLEVHAPGGLQVRIHLALKTVKTCNFHSSSYPQMGLSTSKLRRARLSKSAPITVLIRRRDANLCTTAEQGLAHRCWWMGRRCLRRMFALRCCITACNWHCPGSFGAGTPSRRDLISQARMTKHARSISDTSRGPEGKP